MEDLNIGLKELEVDIFHVIILTVKNLGVNQIKLFIFLDLAYITSRSSDEKEIISNARSDDGKKHID